MARKPTPAGATPADTTPPAEAPAAVPAAPTPAEATAAPPLADAGGTNTSASDDANGGAPLETLSDAIARDVAATMVPPYPSPDNDDDGDALEMGDARVLIAFDEHLPDDLVSGTMAELRVLERDGKVDTHPDAVAYVRSLQA